MQKFTFYLPLFFTISRIIITPSILFALQKESVTGLLIGLILFSYALLSDFLDGFCARRYHAETALGRFLDPLADKLLLWPLLSYLCWRGLLNQWILLVFILRDIFVTLLRIYAQKKNLPFVTSWWAKRKTALQFCMIFSSILLLLAQKMALHYLIQEGLTITVHAATGLALSTALISAFLYLQQFQKNIGVWGLYFICTAGGVGFIPFMPGTWGTLVGLISFVYLIPADQLLASLFLLAIIGLGASNDISKLLNIKDPKFIVIDEVVGFLLAAFLSMPSSFFQLALLFLLFRLFDIIKPWPIKLFEKLPGGLGIMTDDIAAGFFAAASLKAFILIYSYFL